MHWLFNITSLLIITSEINHLAWQDDLFRSKCKVCCKDISLGLQLAGHVSGSMHHFYVPSDDWALDCWSSEAVLGKLSVRKDCRCLKRGQIYCIIVDKVHDKIHHVCPPAQVHIWLSSVFLNQLGLSKKHIKLVNWIHFVKKSPLLHWVVHKSKIPLISKTHFIFL